MYISRLRYRSAPNIGFESRSTDTLYDTESIIWSERFGSYGSFEVVTKDIARAKVVLEPDAIIALDESDYLMRVVSTEIDSEEGTFKAVGKSLESILDWRDAATGPDNQDFFHAGQGGLAAAYLLAMDTVGDQYNVSVPNPWTSDLFPGLNLSTRSGDFKNNTIKVLLEPVPLGEKCWKLLTDDDSSMRCLKPDHPYNSPTTITAYRYIRLQFYRGHSKTSSVVFDETAGHLKNVKIFHSKENVRTQVYTFSPIAPVDFTHVHLYRFNNPKASGYQWTEKTKIVDASSITEVPAGSTPSEILRQKAMEALLDAKEEFYVSAEVEPNLDVYRYDSNELGNSVGVYGLGDKVLVRTKHSPELFEMRVSEFTISKDSSGVRRFPTLIKWEETP